MNWHGRTYSPMLQSIMAKNLLSFGPEGIQLEMKPLNVLVGPNASGKSNLLEAIALLRAAPSELAAPVRSGGGIRNWIWQGQSESPAVVESMVSNPLGRHYIRHRIEFTESSQSFELVDERVETISRIMEKMKYFSSTDSKMARRFYQLKDKTIEGISKGKMLFSTNRYFRNAKTPTSSQSLPI